MWTSIGYKSVAAVGTIGVAKMPSLMEYAFFAQILQGESQRKMQLMQQQRTSEDKLESQTHTTTNIERRIKSGALGDPL